MEYRCFDNTYVVRLERGEELTACLLQLAEAEMIDLASVQGIGAADHIVAGVYDVAEKQYHQQTFSGAFEITALAGNLTRMDGKPYLHLHIMAADPHHGVIAAGHLNSATISATAEIFVVVCKGRVGRRADAEIGLNLLAF